jgi:diguanylate cyclase (GGDEF)-like protein
VRWEGATLQTADFALKVADSLDVLLAYWDKDLICRFANCAYEAWFGRSRSELIGMHLQELLGDLFPLNYAYIEGALAGQVQIFERDIPLLGGGVRNSLASYYPDIVDGVVQGFSVQVTNVTSMKQLQFQLEGAKVRAEELATHDFLTGLPNRVLLTDRIRDAIAAAAQSGQLAAVVAFDLDDFKSINDTYGHDIGDQYLKEIANRMQAAIRVSDALTRLGGDEFILVASGVAGRDSIEALLERMFEYVSIPWTFQGSKRVPSLSGGVAVYPADGCTPEALMKAADSALYSAKGNGKKCFVFSDAMDAGDVGGE